MVLLLKSNPYLFYCFNIVVYLAAVHIICFDHIFYVPSADSQPSQHLPLLHLLHLLHLHHLHLHQLQLLSPPPSYSYYSDGVLFRISQ